MLSEDVSMLWESITMIEAQDQLKRLTVADWPNMKKSQRDKRQRAFCNGLPERNKNEKLYLSK